MAVIEGTALASQNRFDPPLHAIRPGGGGWVTLCTGAMVGQTRTVNRRRCLSCAAELRFLVTVNQLTQEELDVWLASTTETWMV